MKKQVKVDKRKGIYPSTGMEKHGIWTMHKNVLDVSYEARLMVAPGQKAEMRQ